MTGDLKPTGALLVGSAPFDTAEEMFRTSMAHLGAYLKRLPDGEVGERDTWIRWQHKRIGQSPQIAVQKADNVYVPLPLYELVDGVATADEIELPDLGYGAAALASYAAFERLVGEGVIPPDKRFQVGLPTPLSVATFYVEPASRDLFEQAYGRALRREMDKMLEAIPAQKLSIQWEVVGEFGLLEGVLDNHLGDGVLDKIVARLAGLVDLVPNGVETGIHLCYGDSGHKHFCEPRDAGHLVAVSNGVSRAARHAIAWIHMPVPKERDDDGFYKPLANLALNEGTELYLGLVHMTGGLEGTERRLAAASKFVGEFGISTECGFGRRDPATIPALLLIHNKLCS